SVHNSSSMIGLAISSVSVVPMPEVNSSPRKLTAPRGLFETVSYDADTKKARSRKLFEGSKWLEMGYNPKDVWSVSRLHRQHAERVDHPTQKPLEIIERMVLASCPPGGRVLDPFMGSGTTAVACARQGRDFVGYEINESYCAIAHERVNALAAQACA
ncbi:DNA-methyltransferase, partial [Burkholderia vietnamiensis]|uniref:DNA-methyltransferase n=1 Tax=Burkholderia vietnamiensis TaxID=60552 RepID=UPI002012EF53